MERGRETMEVRNLCDRAGTEELGPGAGRNGENPWDLLAAHAGSVGESPSESAFIGHLLLMLPVGERPELPWSTLLCGSSVVGWATTCVLCAPVLCAVPWWGRGSAFNEIPLILWPQALLVSHLQTAL